MQEPLKILEFFGYVNTLYRKNLRPTCYALMKTALSNILLTTLFNVVNSIVQPFRAWIRCNNAEQYSWQHWTMRVAKHCSVHFHASPSFGMGSHPSTFRGHCHEHNIDCRLQALSSGKPTPPSTKVVQKVRTQSESELYICLLIQ